MNLEDLTHLNTKKTLTKDSVVVSFGAFDGFEEIHAVNARLFKEIPKAIGQHDGHIVNIDDTNGQFYTYGVNAEDLFKVMKPILMDFKFLKESIIYLRFAKDGEQTKDLEFKLKD